MTRPQPIPLQRTDPGQPLIRAAFETMTRSNVNVATTTTTDWARELSPAAVGDFIISLAPFSAAARAIQQAAIKTSLAQKASLTLPRRDGNPAANSAFWIGEAEMIPAIQHAVDGVTVGPTCKMAVIECMTRELSEHSAGLQFFTASIKQDFATTLDSTMFSANAASNPPAVPGGLLEGATEVTADDGTNGLPFAIVTDLSNLAGEIAANNGDTASLMYVAAPRQAMCANLWLPNRNIQVFPCAALTDGTVVALETSSLITAFGTEPRISQTRQAPIVLQDPVAPLSTLTGSPPAVQTPFPLVSTFQSDLVAVRVELDVAYAMAAAGRVAVIQSAVWPKTETPE